MAEINKVLIANRGEIAVRIMSDPQANEYRQRGDLPRR
jgi:acetyl/propionyl-CoA carboxylase alpha subunit